MYFNFNPYVSMPGVPDFRLQASNYFGYSSGKNSYLQVKNSKLDRSEEFISCIVYAVDALAMALRRIHKNTGVLSYFPLRPLSLARTDNSLFRSEWCNALDGSTQLVKLKSKTYNFNQIEFFNLIHIDPQPEAMEFLLPLIQSMLIHAGVPLALLDLNEDSIKFNEETKLFGMFGYDRFVISGDGKIALKTLLTGFPISTLVNPSFLWLAASLLRDVRTHTTLKSVNYGEAIEIIRKRDVKELLALFQKLRTITNTTYVNLYSPYNRTGKGFPTFLALVDQGGFYSRFHGYRIQQNRWYTNHKRELKTHGVSLPSWESFVCNDPIKDEASNYSSLSNLDPVKIKDKAEECYAKVKNSRFRPQRNVQSV